AAHFAARRLSRRGGRPPHRRRSVAPERRQDLVKLLALQPGHRLHREELTDTLWPELDWCSRWSRAARLGGVTEVDVEVGGDADAGVVSHLDVAVPGQDVPQGLRQALGRGDHELLRLRRRRDPGRDGLMLSERAFWQQIRADFEMQGRAPTA